MKKFIILMIAVAVILTSSLAMAEGRGATNIMADTLFLRPLGVAALVAGTAAFVLSLPAAAITHSTDKAYEVLVKEPYNYVFVRPIGQIDSGLE